MTTAIAPSKARNWSEVFSKDKGFPDEGTVWYNINSVLENAAMAGRFGFQNMPHEFQTEGAWWDTEDDPNKCKNGSCEVPKDQHPVTLNVVEESLIAWLRTYAEDKRALSLVYGSEEWNKWVADLGERILVTLFIQNQQPKVGHFVGRGFEQNEKDADAFVGAD